MKIMNKLCAPDTKNINSVNFGSVITLTEKPKYWESYQRWSADRLYLLTGEYYRSKENTEQLLIISLDCGTGYGLRQGTQVVVRKDVVACTESS